MRDLLDLLRRNWLFFALSTAAALGLRLLFVFKFPHIEGDSLIYGDIAKNWLAHGIYGVADNGFIRPTLIRLPGYPAFLAATFSVFGQEHYTAVMVLQALIDTNTCLVISALALELMGARAAKAAYLLAALCPFLANYAAAPLSETLAIFCTAHALYYSVRGLKALQAGKPGIHVWAAAGLWTGTGLLMRPDDGIVLAVIGMALLVTLATSRNRKQVVAAGLLVTAVSLAPLAPWTIRNWRTFHVFQPLAPRYANEPGEFVPQGFNHWVKTWLVDYVSVDEIYWNVPGQPIDFHLLPERAFDSRQEYDRTQALVSQYNEERYISPELDSQFERLAGERIVDNPFRYFVWLPLLRITDMWLRPRTEMLPVEDRWWQFGQHTGESWFALLWAGLNLFYLIAALRGWLSRRLGTCGVLLVGFVVVRSLFLGSLENPEPRYMLECFPVVLALAGGAFSRRQRSFSSDDQRTAGPPGGAQELTVH